MPAFFNLSASNQVSSWEATCVGSVKPSCGQQLYIGPSSNYLFYLLITSELGPKCWAGIGVEQKQMLLCDHSNQSHEAALSKLVINVTVRRFRYLGYFHSPYNQPLFIRGRVVKTTCILSLPKFWKVRDVDSLIFMTLSVKHFGMSWELLRVLHLVGLCLFWVLLVFISLVNFSRASEVEGRSQFQKRKGYSIIIYEDGDCEQKKKKKSPDLV